MLSEELLRTRNILNLVFREARGTGNEDEIAREINVLNKTIQKLSTEALQKNIENLEEAEGKIKISNTIMEENFCEIKQMEKKIEKITEIVGQAENIVSVLTNLI